MEMKCIKEYKGIGFLKNDTDRNKRVLIKVGEIITCDNEGYLWKKNICFGHKDAEIPKLSFHICR